MRWMLCCLVVGLVLTAIGCDGEDMRKASLTEEEIRERTFAPEMVRPDELFVSGEKITCEDIMAARPEDADAAVSFKEALEQMAAVMELDAFMERTRPQLSSRLNTNITNMVLYKRAQRQLGDGIEDRLEELAESELRKFTLEHGGNDARADEALKAIGMNRESFKERKKKEALAEYLMASRIYRNRPITYSEIVSKYDQLKGAYYVKPAMLQFRLIDIQISEVELADPNDDPIEKARALADSLVTRLCAGEDFGTLAQEYSNGHRAAVGGLWDPRDPATLASPYDVLPEWAAKIKVDEIAGPIPAPGCFFIMKLVDYREKSFLPLPEVQDQVELQIRRDRRVEDLNKLMAEIDTQVQAADPAPFVDYCLKRLHATVNEAPAADVDKPTP